MSGSRLKRIRPLLLAGLVGLAGCTALTGSRESPIVRATQDALTDPVPASSPSATEPSPDVLALPPREGIDIPAPVTPAFAPTPVTPRPVEPTEGYILSETPVEATPPEALRRPVRLFRKAEQVPAQSWQVTTYIPNAPPVVSEQPVDVVRLTAVQQPEALPAPQPPPRKVESLESLRIPTEPGTAKPAPPFVENARSAATPDKPETLPQPMPVGRSSAGELLPNPTATTSAPAASACTDVACKNPQCATHGARKFPLLGVGRDMPPPPPLPFTGGGGIPAAMVPLAPDLQQRSGPTAAGCILNMPPGESPIERALELNRRLELANAERKALLEKARELEEAVKIRDRALNEATLEVRMATSEVSRTRQELQTFAGNLKEAQERLERLDRENVETLRSIARLLERMVNPDRPPETPDPMPPAGPETSLRNRRTTEISYP